MNNQTLEGRIESTEERLFTEILGEINILSMVIPTKSTIYHLVQQGTGIHRRTVRNIVEETRGTELKNIYNLHQYLLSLIEELIDELCGKKSINSTSKSLADEIMQSKVFINKSAFMDYLLPIINKEIKNTKFPVREVHKVHKYELGDLLYNNTNKKNILPWHYFTYGILRKIKEGELNVDERYLSGVFNTYKQLLKFAYQSLKERSNMPSRFYLEMIGQRLNLSPEAVKSHLFEERIKGRYCNFIAHYNKLIDFIVDELFTKIDFRDENETLKSKLKRFDKIIRDGNYKDNLFVMMNSNMDTDYFEANTYPILEKVMSLASERDFKPLFIFNTAKIGNALQQYL